jgi:predicted nucleic-acid-binding protein
MKSLLASIIIMSALITPASAASCREAVAPVLSEENMAVEEDIIRTLAAVKQYLKLQEGFLSCVSNVSRHNAAIDRMHEVSKRFNTLAKRYKARMEAMDMFTELAYLPTAIITTTATQL